MLRSHLSRTGGVHFSPMDTEIVLLTDILTKDHYRYEQCPDVPREETNTCKVEVGFTIGRKSREDLCSAHKSSTDFDSKSSRRVTLASRHQHYTFSMFSYLISTYSIFRGFHDCRIVPGFASCQQRTSCHCSAISIWPSEHGHQNIIHIISSCSFDHIQSCWN